MTVPSAPIVLAHGLAGFSQIAVRRLGVATYFRGIPEHLASLGCRVVVTHVPPLGSVASRAEALRRNVLDEVGAARFHVVAHSMGGLDTRHAITHLGLADRVIALVTLGTPHRGSPVADRVFEIARRLGVGDALRRSGLGRGALEDLRTDTCGAWSRSTPDAPGVRYLSVAGVKPRDEMIYGLRFTHDVIAPLEGVNDGLVSARSAAWGEVLPRWDCDHVNLVGWTGPRTSALGYARDVRPRFARLARRLAEVERG